jgi:TIR domain-containing protein
MTMLQDISNDTLQVFFWLFVAAVILSLLFVIRRTEAPILLKASRRVEAEPYVSTAGPTPNIPSDDAEPDHPPDIEKVSGQTIMVPSPDNHIPPLELLSDPYAEIDQCLKKANEALPPPSDKVEIFAIGPKTIGPKQSCRIFVNIMNLGTAAEQGHPDADTFDSIITEIQRGSRIGVVFEVLPTIANRRWAPPQWRVDAPYQALTWQGNNVVVDFVLRTEAIKDPVLLQGRLWLTIGYGTALPRAKIDISIQVVPDPKARETKQFFVSEKSQMAHEEIQDVWRVHQYSGVGTKAMAFNTAFIVYRRSDDQIARHYKALLEAAGLRCDRDQESFRPIEDWKEQVDPFLQEADMIVVIWSEAASKSENVRYELRRIESIRKQRKERHEEYMGNKAVARPGRPNPSPVKPEPIVYVLHVDNRADPLPEWFRENMGHAASPERTRSGSYPSGASSPPSHL